MPNVQINNPVKMCAHKMALYGVLPIGINDTQLDVSFDEYTEWMDTNLNYYGAALRPGEAPITKLEGHKDPKDNIPEAPKAITNLFNPAQWWDKSTGNLKGKREWLGVLLADTLYCAYTDFKRAGLSDEKFTEFKKRFLKGTDLKLHDDITKRAEARLKARIDNGGPAILNPVDPVLNLTDLLDRLQTDKELTEKKLEQLVLDHVRDPNTGDADIEKFDRLYNVLSSTHVSIDSKGNPKTGVAVPEKASKMMYQVRVNILQKAELNTSENIIILHKKKVAITSGLARAAQDTENFAELRARRRRLGFLTAMGAAVTAAVGTLTFTINSFLSQRADFAASNIGEAYFSAGFLNAGTLFPMFIGLVIMAIGAAIWYYGVKHDNKMLETLGKTIVAFGGFVTAIFMFTPFLKFVFGTMLEASLLTGIGIVSTFVPIFGIIYALYAFGILDENRVDTFKIFGNDVTIPTGYVGKKIAQIGLGVGVLIGAATVLAALGAPPLMVGTLIVAVTLVFAYMAYKLYSESVEQMKTSHGHVVGITSEKMADMATPNLRQNAPRMPPPRPLTQRQPVVIGQLTRVKIDPSELKSNQGTAATPKAGK